MVTDHQVRLLRRKLCELAVGEFLDRAVNVLAFGLPEVGTSHVGCAIGHAFIEEGRSVMFAPTYALAQQLQAAERELELPKLLRKLDHFELSILDDIG